MTSQSRSKLYEFFKSGAKPSGNHFRDLIDSTLNIKDDGIEVIGTETNQDINLVPKGTGNLLISGNVGIGTPRPRSTLDVRKDASGTLGPILTLSNFGEGLGAATAIDFNGYDVGSDSSTARVQSIDDGNYSSHLAFFTKEPGKRTNGLQERLKISSNGKVGIGTTNPSTELEVAGTITANEFVGIGAVVTGMILMWSGSIEQVPVGWVLCDGNNNTPDLRDRFVVGVGKKYGIGDKGGADEVTLLVDEIPSHNHDNGEFQYLVKRGGGETTQGWDACNATQQEINLAYSKEIKPTGGDKAHENRPPYYALCYIMKL